MYLKSIDLIGYKSFAAKTHLDLEPGITGIIGPNGCGKSNIMEAVRWCLGEMSWKSLRAGSMIEVIFSGTAKRPPLSMTEVTLTFDNSSSLLALQFSEVVITRRIYRSGEGAYFLNRTQCRLRDIRELFLDTGVGGDGYAIIDQGGVDFVLSSKPEDRRSLFEEAAGVAKYKSKREEALRKLERVEMDMGRLSDSLSLINEQVNKLDSDARKARLFKKHKEELAAMEAAQIIGEVDRLQGGLEALGAKLSPLEESLGARRVELDAEGANLAALNLEKAGQQGRMIEANQKIAGVKAEIGRLEERIQSAERSISEAKERGQACEAELALARRRRAGIDPDIEAASSAVAQAEGLRSAAQAEAEESSKRLSEFELAIGRAQAAFDALRNEALAAAEEALVLRRRLAEAESGASRQQTQARSSLRELEKDFAQAEASRREIAAARDALLSQEAREAEARGALEKAEGELSALRRGQSALSEDALRLHAELAQARARFEAVEAQGGQNPYWAGAQAVLNAGIEGVVGTVRQLIKVEEPLRPYVEDVLGERLYAVVCEDSTAARAAVELLSASGKGRARLLVLSSLPEGTSARAYPPEARPLMSGLRFDPRYEKAVRFLLEESYTLGKALFGEHWVYGGAVPRESAQLSLADVGEFRAKVADLEAGEARLAGGKARLESELAAAEAFVRAAGAALAQESARVHGLKAQIAEKEAGLAAINKSAELSTADAAGYLSELAATMGDLGGLRAGIEGALARETAARAKEGEAAAGLGRLKEERHAAHTAWEVSKAKLAGFEAQLAHLAGAYERLAEEKKGLEDSIARRLQELADLSRREEESRLLAAQSREKLGELNAGLAQFETEANAVHSRIQELDLALAAKEASLRSLKAAVDELQAELHRYEVEASGLKATQDALKKRLWDDWQLTFEEAKAKHAAVEVDAERIESLRKRIAAMGNINMAAPEEYEALSARQSFLSSQIADLTAAKDDLKSAIQKINNATKENFRQTFTEVRDHFRRLYGVLFEGGEADLVLTDPDNILETGVEIVAQPPGKRLQSISLLSGGEKTLTAIALLFAFFMVRPSPFCMLDEADAALDDANVERFVALLREFQARTQFLIVSHNKRTMEASGVIYGVTMEEMGVSQLVSVDFRMRAPEPAGAAPGASANSAPA